MALSPSQFAPVCSPVGQAQARLSEPALLMVVISFVVVFCLLSPPAWPQLHPNIPARPGQGTHLPPVPGGSPPGPSADPKPRLLLAHPETCSNAAQHSSTHPNPRGVRVTALHAHMHMHIHMHIRTHAHMHAHISCPHSAERPWSTWICSFPASRRGSSHTLTCTRRHALALVHARVRMLTCVCMCMPCMHTPTRAHPHTCICTHMHRC